MPPLAPPHDPEVTRTQAERRERAAGRRRRHAWRLTATQSKPRVGVGRNAFRAASPRVSTSTSVLIYRFSFSLQTFTKIIMTAVMGSEAHRGQKC